MAYKYGFIFAPDDETYSGMCLLSVKDEAGGITQAILDEMIAAAFVDGPTYATELSNDISRYNELDQEKTSEKETLFRGLLRGIE